MYYEVKWTKLHSLGGKLNQVIIQGVIQTLAIVQGSNLDFFLSFSLDNSYLGLKMVIGCCILLPKKKREELHHGGNYEFHQQYAKVSTFRYVLLLTLNKALREGSPRIAIVCLMVRVKISSDKFQMKLGTLFPK